MKITFERHAIDNSESHSKILHLEFDVTCSMLSSSCERHIICSKVVKNYRLRSDVTVACRPQTANRHVVANTQFFPFRNRSHWNVWAIDARSTAWSIFSCSVGSDLARPGIVESCDYARVHNTANPALHNQTSSAQVISSAKNGRI